MMRNVPALWLSLLSPEQIERLELGENFTVPHPDFPEVVDLFFVCTGCYQMHWQPTLFLLEVRGGGIAFIHQRQHVAETERLQHLYTDADKYQADLEEARKDPTPVRRREACTHMPPAVFTERTRKLLRDGETAYLEQVRATGEDPCRYLGGESHPAHLKLIARAELQKRGQPEQKEA